MEGGFAPLLIELEDSNEEKQKNNKWKRCSS